MQSRVTLRKKLSVRKAREAIRADLPVGRKFKWYSFLSEGQSVRGKYFIQVIGERIPPSEILIQYPKANLGLGRNL